MLVSLFRLTTLFSAMALAVLVCSCGQSLEQALTPDFPLDYKERIFMEGALIAGEPIRNIRLSRTLESLQPINRELAAITTATVRLRTGGREYAMTLQPQTGFSSTGTVIWRDPRAFYSANGVIAEEGMRYEIIAQWNGKTARVSTTVPHKARIDSVRETNAIVDERGMAVKEFRYEAVITVRSGEVYQAGVVLGQGADTISTTYNGTSNAGALKAATAADNAGKLRLQSPAIFQTPNAMNVLQDPTNPHVVVYSFDAPFAEYFNSYQRGFITTDPFSVGGVNVRWNVVGDGIGIVIGMASARKRVR
jgi:hypothetical protein